VNLEKTYQEKFGKEVGVRSLGWSNEHTQKIRFKVLMEISGLEITDSVLDVGCGHGD
jgi:cyclopropane fatty-acyl-phospholipid synthase-like methyltransferase